MGRDFFMSDPKFRLFPGTSQWYGKIPNILALAKESKPDRIFILQDPWHFSEQWMRDMNKVAPVTFYCPVDGLLRPEMIHGIHAATNIVAYTEYGAKQILESMHARDTTASVSVIPHGTDFESFHPIAESGHLRKKLFGGWLEDDDILMTYVGMHQKRKAWWSVLQIFAELAPHFPKLKLLMHTQMNDKMEGTNVASVAKGLGLGPNKVLVPQKWFNESGLALVNNKGLNEIYNCTDAFITCSLGEGWGLPITEALASGVPAIFVPDHSACREIYETTLKLGHSQIETLPLSNELLILPNDNCLPRRQVDVRQSAEMVEDRITSGFSERGSVNDATREWLSWDRIADCFLSLMEVPRA